MSVSPIDDDNDNKINKKQYSPKNKKYVRIWRLEASKEFILFMGVIIFAIATSLYNPIELQKVGRQLVEIAQQNNETNLQNLNNTNQIINYLDISNQNDTAKGMDIIKVLFLYEQDAQRDHAKIMEELNISNTHFVKVNNTHVITENGTAVLPYPIDMQGFDPRENVNTTLDLETIKN